MANMFDKARKTAAPKAAAGKKKDKEEVKIEGLATLAQIDAAIKSLTALKETYEPQVKDAMRSHFATVGHDTGKRPESFRGIDGKDASASCEMRKRSTTSGLNDDEVDLLTKLGVSFTTEVSVAGTFIINPEYAANNALLERISKALSKVKDVPEDFLMWQDEKSKRVVTEESVDQVFKLKTPEMVEQALTIVSVMAVKPKLAETDVAKILGSLQDLVKE